MESVELSAKSVDEAIQQALIRLGRSREEVDVVVLSEGHKGILGFVRGDSARVKVTVREGAAAPATSTGIQTEAPETRDSVSAEVSSTPSSSPSKRPPSGAAIVAVDTLEELLERMGIDADVLSRGGDGTEEAPIMLDVSGEELGILIGRRGETLSSLQFLLNVMVGKRLDSWVRVLVDIEGYRARREESLRSMAARAADRVRRSGRPMMLQPMPANERRIIHLSLQGSPYVTTESSGVGEDRRVTVYPKARQISGY